MKKSTKINIGFTILAIIISGIALTSDFFQNKKISKIQYELNAINYKPIIKVDSILLTSFHEKIDSAVLVGELNDSTGLINVYTRIFSDISFKLKNIGNTNAKIRATLCIDTISGGDKLRDLFFNEGYKINPDSIKNEFYDYWQLQPNDVDKIEINTEIKFVKNETFTIHLLIFYENDLDILYDTYYWAKFQKKNLIMDMEVDTIKNQVINTKMALTKNQYLKFIDQNVAYKTYSKTEKDKFDRIIHKIKNNER